MKRCISFLALLSMTLFLYARPLAAQGQGRPPSPAPQRPSPPPRPETSRPPDTPRAPESKGKPEQAGERRTASQQLAANPKLSERLKGLFPEGTDLQLAADGFRNVGLFVAAARVSHNLNIPFDQLKSTMMGPPEKNLGAAIHELKPDADAKAEARKAEKQAKKDMDDSRRSE